MPRDVEPIKVEHKYGEDWETHPAFGHIHANRVSSNPPTTLFDSEIQHNHYVVLSITTAERKRDLNRDWIYPGSTPIIEVAMSEAQWASLVSSMNAGGTPCTIASRETQRRVPELPYRPRMAESIAEIRETVDKLLERAREALAAYKEHKTVGNLRELELALQQATGSAVYAAQSLTEHVENTVTRAKADIEAMVNAHAERLGIEAPQYTAPLAIESAVVEEESR